MNCPNCGATVEDGIKFCPNCGSDISAAMGAAETVGTETDSTETAYESTETVTGTTEDSNGTGNRESYERYPKGNGTVRNIALCIVLSLVTCGIYVFYWIYCLNEDINSLAGEENATGGGMVILFTIITCGIYGLYWYYKMGERVDSIKNQPGASTPILFLILSIFCHSIVNLCLMQDCINKACEG